jgi:hypothetical protein
MRIGTLTFHKTNNYGAVLQAYALQKYLLDAGFEAEIIDYRPNAGTNIVQRSFKNKALYYLFKPNVLIERKIRQRKFNEFRHNHMNIASTIFLGDEQISNNPPPYDLYIVGSDQVWNTDITNMSKAFFLNFVKSGRKISYAASLGKDEFNETEKKYMKDYLNNFDGIAVRESLLQQKLQEEFSINAEHVLDPIFLLNKENWIKVASRIRLPKKYVLCYMMEYSQELIDHTNDVARQLHCSPIFISPSHTHFSGRILKGLGPSEFIYTLANARYICTNSFHGTAFSLIFQKDFTVVRHSRLNSRISSLIELVGLNERFFDDANHRIKEIEYKKVTKRLQKKINKSQEYIRVQFEQMKG